MLLTVKTVILWEKRIYFY